MNIPLPDYNEWDDLYMLVRDLFVAASITCFLLALHRIGSAMMLGARMEALDGYREAYTPEEREVLIHKIKHASQRY